MSAGSRNVYAVWSVFCAPRRLFFVVVVIEKFVILSCKENENLIRLRIFRFHFTDGNLKRQQCKGDTASGSGLTVNPTETHSVTEKYNLPIAWLPGPSLN